MTMRRIAIMGTAATLAAAGAWLYAQDQTVFRVKVDMVVLSFTVTDNKGRYVTGLKHSDFRILEDGIPQKAATFAEGNKPPVQVMDDGSTQPIIAAGTPGARPEAVVLEASCTPEPSPVRVRVRRDRRLRARARPGGFRCRVHVQP